MDRRRLTTCAAKLGIEQGENDGGRLFTVQKSECLGACADSPVMLVNDRQMCSFYDGNDRLDALLELPRRRGEQGLNTMTLDLTSFRRQGRRPASMAATSRRRSTPT